jgi:hypothetical protein
MMMKMLPMKEMEMVMLKLKKRDPVLKMVDFFLYRLEIDRRQSQHQKYLAPLPKKTNKGKETMMTMKRKEMMMKMIIKMNKDE